MTIACVLYVSLAEEGKVSAEQIGAKNIANFLKTTPGLGKTQIGEYLSKGPPDRYPFHAAVLKEYVDTFDFAGSSSIYLSIYLSRLRQSAL